MSDRSKRLLTLALNQALAKKISTYKATRTKNNDICNEDPDFVPGPELKEPPVKPKHVRRLELPENIIDGVPKKAKDNIISDITICKAPIISPKKLEVTEKHYEKHISEILNQIVEDAMEIAEKEHLRKFTKEGKLRKRKLYDESLQERKKQKWEQKSAKHGVQETCKENCTRKCSLAISTDRQNAINKEFWELAYEQQRQFIFSSVNKSAKKRKTKDGESRRNNTIFYYLKSDSGTDVNVCKKFFLAILGYQVHNDRIIRDVLNKAGPKDLLVKPLKRGHPSEKKLDRIAIIHHINSFNPSIFHYRREHAPNRKYLPSDIHIKLMHKDFLDKYPGMNVSYELYRQQVSEMNISFAVLGHEECWQCETFELHSKISKHEKKNIQVDCEDCQKWKLHYEQATRARKEYTTDTSSISTGTDSLCFSADLQKVIMLPLCEMFKEIIFTPRIICFNESFVLLGRHSLKNKPVAVIWHEGVAGRSISDIISTFYNFFLFYRDVKEITIWLDNCVSQNKNWALYSFFLYLINSSEVNLNLLKVKYLRTGHTFMSADSFHHQVEKSLKQTGKVLDFEDFKLCVKKSNNSRVEVIEMNLNNFYDFKDFSSRFKINKITPKPYLSDFVEVHFTRGSKHLCYETKFGGEFIELNFLLAKHLKEALPKPTVRLAPKGIDRDRKTKLLQKLPDIVPPNRLKFWEDLPVAEGATIDSD